MEATAVLVSHAPLWTPRPQYILHHTEKRATFLSACQSEGQCSVTIPWEPLPTLSVCILPTVVFKTWQHVLPPLTTALHPPMPRSTIRDEGSSLQLHMWPTVTQTTDKRGALVRRKELSQIWWCSPLNPASGRHGGWGSWRISMSWRLT